MRYALVLMTHGTGETLGECFSSFMENVTPEPWEFILHADAPTPENILPPLLKYPDTQIVSREQGGFCASCRRAWNEVAFGEYESDFVFWLEHDFLFERRVDLRPLAEQLEADRSLAQMSLMRGPVSAPEIAAGGLYEYRRDAFELNHTNIPTRAEAFPYLRHSAYFTTTPSLMTHRFMRDNPWPDYPKECEGRFGIDLRMRGYDFGVWGEGEPWVTHIGLRTGFGY